MKLHTHIVMDVHGDTRHTFNPVERGGSARGDEALR